MTKPGEGKVTVRVEVVVEGAGGAPVRTVVEVTQPTGPIIKQAQIDSPRPAPADTPVYSVNGNRVIEASGTSPQVGGSFPQKVWALAFCGLTVTPQQFPTPPQGAVSDTPLSDGSYSFTRAKGNAVPGACCDGTPGSSGAPNNSTLIVWFDFGGGPSSFATASTPFHGYCPGSGSGPALGSGPVVVGSQVVPALLHATFTGALAVLGSVALAWDGVSWVGETHHRGGAVLSLLGREATFQLQATGPATTFVVAAKPRSFRPFHWSARGQALGALAGKFEVTLLE